MFRPCDNMLYLFGGICQEPLTNMATFDLNVHMTSQNKYKVLEAGTQTGLSKVKGVFGLGSCNYNNKLYYLFGGLGFHKSL